MSNYKVGKKSLYSEADNATRKNRNSLGGGHFDNIGPNKNAKPYSVTGSNPAGREATKFNRLNRKQPIKQLTSQELQEYNKKKMDKSENIEITPDGKQEIVPGVEPLKKKPKSIKKSLSDIWQELKKDLDNASAIMPMEDNEEQDSEENGNQDHENLQQGNNPDDQNSTLESEEGQEDPQAAEQELAQALKDLGHSDAEIAYIVHGHMLPTPDLEVEKVKSEAMSGQVESQIASEEHTQNKQHKEMEAQTNLEHQKKMNELAQQEAQEKKGVHKIDQDHKKRMVDLEYEHAKKQKDLEFNIVQKQKNIQLSEVESSSGVGKVETEHKKRMLDLEYENAKKEKELELKFMEAEHKQKLKLMEETSKHKTKQAQEDAKVNSVVKKEQAKHKVSDAKKSPVKKLLKKSEDEYEEVD